MDKVNLINHGNLKVSRNIKEMKKILLALWCSSRKHMLYNLKRRVIIVVITREDIVVSIGCPPQLKEKDYTKKQSEPKVEDV